MRSKKLKALLDRPEAKKLQTVWQKELWSAILDNELKYNELPDQVS